MIFDQIMLVAVLVMLIGSTFMAWSLRLSVRSANQAFEALVRQIGGMGLAMVALDRKVENLEQRIEELEK